MGLGLPGCYMSSFEKVHFFIKLSVLQETWNTFGNPVVQKSDNRPPFNLEAMKSFTNSRDIKQVKIPPGLPSPNNVETLMKTPGRRRR